MKYIQKWLHDNSGVSGMEYGILGGGISLAIVAAIFICGDSISSVMDALSLFIQENL